MEASNSGRGFSGNNARLAPGFVRSCFRICPERFRIATGLVESEENRQV